MKSSVSSANSHIIETCWGSLDLGQEIALDEFVNKFSDSSSSPECASDTDTDIFSLMEVEFDERSNEFFPEQDTERTERKLDVLLITFVLFLLTTIFFCTFLP